MHSCDGVLSQVQVKSFRVQKQTLFGEFRGQLEAEFGVPRARQRLWFWEQRPNFTLRPWKPVPPDADEQQVQTVRTPRDVKNPPQQGANELFLWLGALLCIVSSLAMLYLQQCLSIGRTFYCAYDLSKLHCNAGPRKTCSTSPSAVS